MRNFEKIYKSSKILRKFERNAGKILKQGVSSNFFLYFGNNLRKQNYNWKFLVHVRRVIMKVNSDKIFP